MSEVQHKVSIIRAELELARTEIQVVITSITDRLIFSGSYISIHQHENLPPLVQAVDTITGAIEVLDSIIKVDDDER